MKDKEIKITQEESIKTKHEKIQERIRKFNNLD